MVYNFIAILLALVMLIAGEKLKNETKTIYIKEGYSWSKVLIYSSFSALIGGLLSLFLIEIYSIPEHIESYLIVFGVTVASYITTQSFMTDLRVLLINRNILRVAYISMYLIGVYNIAFNESFRGNLVPFIAFTVLLIILFLFSSIGASDIRAIAVLMPFVVSIGGFFAVQLFIISLLLVSFAMIARNYFRDRKRMRELKEEGIASGNYQKMNKLAFYKVSKDIVRAELTKKEMAMPVGPYMILPFLIYLIALPVIT